MKVILTATLLLFSLNCFGGDQSTTSTNNLCSSSEQSLFFCKGENKTAGVCASNQLDNLSGFAQYRVFNIKKNEIEFLFPKTLIPPKENFIINSHPLPGGGRCANQVLRQWLLICNT